MRGDRIQGIRSDQTESFPEQLVSYCSPIFALFWLRAFLPGHGRSHPDRDLRASVLSFVHLEKKFSSRNIGSFPPRPHRDFRRLKVYLKKLSGAPPMMEDARQILQVRVASQQRTATDHDFCVAEPFRLWNFRFGAGMKPALRWRLLTDH